jgi:proteasome alpha subunit
MMGYDRAITVFSPDGRLLQVEYAKQAVSKGTMTIGMVCNEGVLLLADRRVSDELIIMNSIKKVWQIDDHIAASFAGLTSDARVMVKRSRVYAQQHKLTYGEPLDVEGMVKFISDMEQMHTLYGGIRPFGVSFLFGGVDSSGNHLFMTDPSGIYGKYKAKSIGQDSEDADKLLVKKYRDDMPLKEGLKLAVSIFKQVLGKDFSKERLEGVTIFGDKVHKVDMSRV